MSYFRPRRNGSYLIVTRSSAPAQAMDRDNVDGVAEVKAHIWSDNI